MAHTIIRPKDREEWLQHRAAGIGSSEVGTIMGVNPYESPYQLWARKKGLVPAKEENFLMKAGHYLEDAVSKFFADETGADIIKSSAGDWLCIDTEHEWRRVSPDRIYWESDSKHSNGNKRILECKTTQMDVDYDNIPRYWFCQLQYQLGVSELQAGAIAWLTQGRKFGYRQFDLNPEFYAYMMEEVDKFYIDNIKGGKEPECVCLQDVMMKYPASVAGKTIEAGTIKIGEYDIDIVDAVGQLKELKAKINELDGRKTEIEDAIKMYMTDNEVMTAMIDGKAVNIATWKSNKSSMKLDTKALQADNPELCAKYMREIAGARVLRIK